MLIKLLLCSNYVNKILFPVAATKFNATDNFAAVHSFPILCDVQDLDGIGGLMRWCCVLMLVAVGCTARKGDPGPPGPPGPPGKDGTNGTNGTNGTTPDGGTPPQAVTCAPGEGFCVNNHLATCTLSGADAVLGIDCATQGSTNNPATCVTTGCPSGQAACCRRTKPLWKWDFTQPAAVGESYVGFESGKEYIGLGKTCTGGSSLVLASVGYSRPLSTCPSNYISINASFDRSTVAVATTITLPPAPGTSLSMITGAGFCNQWTGTMRIDSDLPDWSVIIDAMCSNGALSGAQIIGTMSGSE